MRRLATAVLLALAATACGSDAAPAEEVDGVELLAMSAAAMERVESARYEMERDGATVTVQGLTFDGAVGEYGAPDSARAILRMRAGDIAVELGTISIGPRTWVTSPLTGAWEELEPGTGFNPAMLFDPEQGWTPMLTTDISAVEYVGTDGDLQVVKGTLAGDRVAVLTAGVAAAQPVEMEIRLDREAMLLARLEFITVGDEGESSWVIRLSEYDRPVDIQAPNLG